MFPGGVLGRLFHTPSSLLEKGELPPAIVVNVLLAKSIFRIEIPLNVYPLFISENVIELFTMLEMPLGVEFMVLFENTIVGGSNFN